MLDKNMVRISVRNLIEFVMRSGDIDNSFKSNDRALEGIIAHNKIQSEYDKNYRKEVSMINTTKLEDVTFIVSGRCDGLFESGDVQMIDEIKSTTRLIDDLDPEINQMHWAQAKLYGYFYMEENKTKSIDVQLTYINIDEDYVKRHKITFSYEELKDFYLKILHKYLDFSKRIVKWREIRDESLKEVPFPHKEYRKGQRKMSVGIYQAILEKKNLFIDAPTGIGKTMSSLYPSVKAIGEKLGEKVFYLTARTTTQNEAVKAISLLKDKGGRLKTTVITAKEKSCINDEKVKCNPKDCPYAKGHFDRINDAIIDLYENEDLLDNSTIQIYAEKHKVCPFEFSLDMSIYSDVIICDYNYAFSPGVYLKRFFEESTDPYIFLIDEAHNLIDRGKDMYSSSLSKEYIKESKGLIPKKNKKIREEIGKLLGKFEDIEYELKDDENYIKNKQSYRKEKIEEIDEIITQILTNMDKFLAKERTYENYNEVLDFYFYLNEYERISEIYQDGYLTTLEKIKDDFIVSLKCIDTSNIFEQLLKRSRSAILFSATLTPIEYYMELLGGGKDALSMHLQSPFDKDNLLLMNQASLSTRYKDREKTKDEIVDFIHEFITSKKGNFFVYFPSYRYLEKIYESYMEKYNDDILLQERFMSSDDRKVFINSFREDSNIKAFGVLGGIFAEGIDLVGERLIGVCVVSVGMPGLSYERKLIQEYFDEKENKGFDYAFTYPGINKVLQGAGRVIRSEKDKGIVLLIDDRFNQTRYKKLYPKHWSNMKYIRTIDEMKIELDNFWRGNDI